MEAIVSSSVVNILTETHALRMSVMETTRMTAEPGSDAITEKNEFNPDMRWHTV